MIVEQNPVIYQEFHGDKYSAEGAKLSCQCKECYEARPESDDDEDDEDKKKSWYTDQFEEIKTDEIIQSKPE